MKCCRFHGHSFNPKNVLRAVQKIDTERFIAQGYADYNGDGAKYYSPCHGEKEDGSNMC